MKKNYYSSAICKLIVLTSLFGLIFSCDVEKDDVKDILDEKVPSVFNYEPNQFSIFEEEGFSTNEPEVDGDPPIQFRIINQEDGYSVDELGVVSLIEMHSYEASTQEVIIEAYNEFGSLRDTITVEIKEIPIIPPTEFSYETQAYEVTVGQEGFVTSLPTANGSDTLMYALVDNFDGNFSISEEGIVTLKEEHTLAVTEEEKPHILTVKVSNKAGEFTTDISIKVNQIPPTSLSYEVQAFEVTSGKEGFTTSAPTTNGSDPLKFELVDDMDGNFSISEQGVVTLKDQHTLAVTAEDQSHSLMVKVSNNAGTFTTTITVTVKQVAPTALSYEVQAFEVTSGKEGFITSVPTTDGSGPLKFELVDDLNGNFSISEEGIVTLKNEHTLAITEEDQPHTLTVKVSNDAGEFKTTISIKVNQVPPTALTYEVQEFEVTFGKEGFTTSAPTANGTAPLSFELVNDMEGNFSITEQGVVTLKEEHTLAVTTEDQPHILTVKVSNKAGEFTTDITIKVNQIPPTALSYEVQAFEVTYGKEGFTTSAPTANGTDPLSFELVDDMDGNFSISDEGIVTLKEEHTLDITVEDQPHILTVKVSNNAGEFTTDITIKVNQLAPSALSYEVQAFEVTSGKEGFTTSAPTANGSDPLSFELVDDMEGNFGISEEGIVTLKEQHTLAVTTEDQPHTITVKVSNDAGEFTTDITVKVNAIIAPTELSYEKQAFEVVYGKDGFVTSTPTANGSPTLMYRLVDDMEGNFSISEEGIVTLKNEHTLAITEADQVHTVTVKVSNEAGEFATDLTVKVVQIAPTTLTYAETSFQVAEGKGLTIPAPTTDGSAPLTYTLVEYNESDFTINETTGAVTLKENHTLAIGETKTITIKVENAAGNTTASLSVEVLAPELTLSYNLPAEGYKIISEGDGSFTSDAPTVHDYFVGKATFSLPQNAIDAGFSIDANSGVFTQNNVAKGTYIFDVKASYETAMVSFKYTAVVVEDGFNIFYAETPSPLVVSASDGIVTTEAAKEWGPREPNHVNYQLRYFTYEGTLDGETFAETKIDKAPAEDALNPTSDQGKILKGLGLTKKQGTEFNWTAFRDWFYDGDLPGGNVTGTLAECTAYTFDASTLPAGTYKLYLRLLDGDGKNITHKHSLTIIVK
ncbi:hypothetical protein [Flammeovirga aprica]|uniref:Cadherin domain-containing protein n=1 Tax=Flammeovirga aprica JL-4 TaxID=694437 RepID=A0A7X9P075_9BACT|nr:hypothetical protein [Flammeovirga aprica]NME66808.1 hypothetical protein [Flammeovirga aprica JL-4]